MMNCGIEERPSGVKKLVQVSEEVQKPVHVPVVLGNECFIITQQDVRKIEDIRFISYHKLGPNGELIPIEAGVGQEYALRDAITNAARFQAQNEDNAVARQLMEMFGKSCGPPNSTKATIAQQMSWASACDTPSAAFPLTYSKSTSMNDMPVVQNRCFNQPCCCICQPKYLTNQGCNTMDTDSSTEPAEDPPSARQMLKMRKITEDTMGV